MGTKEDLARQRLETERRAEEQQALRDATEAAKSKADEEAEFARLLADIDEEASRLAGILETADWSRAEIWKFTGAHWWQCFCSKEYACLELAPLEPDDYESLYMRSDGILFIQGYRRRARPQSFYETYGRDRVDFASQLLRSLKKITTLEDLV